MTVVTKNYYEEVTQTIDKETGELETVRRTVKRKVSRDQFVMFFFRDIQGLIDLSSRAEFKVLLSICEMVGYNTNEVILIKSKKEEIVKKTGLSYSSVHNTISRLCKKKVLLRQAQALYILNPKFAFKGEEIHRAKKLQLVLEYQLES